MLLKNVKINQTFLINHSDTKNFVGEFFLTKLFVGMGVPLLSPFFLCVVPSFFMSCATFHSVPVCDKYSILMATIMPFGSH